MSTIEINAIEDLREGDYVTLRWEKSEDDTVTLEGPMRFRAAVGGYVITDARFVSATREAPEWEPGTAGTATVRGVEGVRVLRTAASTHGSWFSAKAAGATHLHPDSQVRDFVPDDIEALRQDLARCKEAAMVHERDAQACRAEAEQLRPEVAKYRKEVERLRRLLSMAREENRTSRDAWWAEARKLEAEAERLRDSMDTNTNVLVSSNGTIWHHDTQRPHRRTMPTREQIVGAMWPGAPESARAGMTHLEMVDRVVALFEQGDAE